jgi:hypothetical protein
MRTPFTRRQCAVIAAVRGWSWADTNGEGAHKINQPPAMRCRNFCSASAYLRRRSCNVRPHVREEARFSDGLRLFSFASVPHRIA